jgi:S-DNA-T family DNA segregation ATPase FtsK/SpoIIIE
VNGCESCAFAYDDVAPESVGRRLVGLAPRLTACLITAEERGIARVRPEPRTWSVLEYACHVRDVLAVQRGRILRACSEEVPCLPSMRGEERAVTERYVMQGPEAVRGALIENAATLAKLLDSLTASQWQRTVLYPYAGEHTERSVAWIARHTLHELVHHGADMERGLTGRP